VAPIYFLHITKTAGGSIKEAFRNSDVAVQFHYRGQDGFKQYFNYAENVEVVFGHYIFGAHNFAETPPTYACFVREPVARTLSHYHHLKNNDRGPVGEKVRSFEDIDTTLLQMKHWEFDNFLCRIISGIGKEVKFGDVGFNTYELARRNLKNHFEFIGIFEEMRESLVRLNRKFPSLGLDLGTVNLGKYDKVIPEKTRELLIRLNRFDELLYQDALKLFHQT
jgi:hypothetical protein